MSAKYETYEHAGCVPLQEWHDSGVGVLVFDKDNTLTSFHDPEFIEPVIAGLLEHRLPDLFPVIALASNSDDSQHIREVGNALGDRLGGLKSSPSVRAMVTLASQIQKWA